jgi:prepilin-type N-terminal cleavage/methylation domain-containing protein
MRTHRPTPPRRALRPGFTLVELLVAIGIVALLISILAVALARALSGGRRAATEQYLRNVAFALESFKSDFNYYPPLLNDDAEAFQTPERLTVVDGINAAGARDEGELDRARFHSIFSLPFYLVGVGDLAPRGHLAGNPQRDDGAPGPGIRDPGPDKAWGGARERTADTHRPAVQGRTFGPYMEVANKPDVFRVVEGRDFRRFYNSNAGEAFDQMQRQQDDREDIYVFVDRWERPIRYYRAWPTRDPLDPRKQSLERTPIELLTAETLRANNQGMLDPALEKELLMAPFVLLSGGEDEDVAAPMPEADSETVDRGFVEAEIDDAFRNSGALRPFTEQSASTVKRNRLKALEKSLENNIRVTP